MNYAEFERAIQEIFDRANRRGSFADHREKTLVERAGVADFASRARRRGGGADLAIQCASFSIVRPAHPESAWYMRCSIGRIRFGPSFAISDCVIDAERTELEQRGHVPVVLESEAAPRQVIPVDAAVEWVYDQWRIARVPYR